MRATHEFEADFRARVLQDCLASALPAVWERRAAAWEAARPRADDFNGRATRDELVDREIRCRDTAAACRAHAQVLREPELIDVSYGSAFDVSYEVTNVLAEVA